MESTSQDKKGSFEKFNWMFVLTIQKNQSLNMKAVWKFWVFLAVNYF